MKKNHLNLISKFVLSLFIITAITNFNNEIKAQSTQKDVSVTIYNSNLGVIKDTREVKLTKGINQLNITDVASSVYPSSVLIKIPTAEVIEQNYQYDLVSINKILNKYIDQEVTIKMENNNIITGKLLNAGSQVVLQKDDGGLIMLPDVSKSQISVPKLPENFITRPTLVWTIKANKTEDQTAELTYHTSGLNWNAEYVAELDPSDKKMNISAWVTLKNTSGTTYNNAKVKLIAGDINQVSNSGYNDEYRLLTRKTTMDLEIAEEETGFAEKEFFEYHLYDLGRRTTIKNNENKQLALFDAKDVPVKKILSVNTTLSPYTQNKELNANVSIKFKNSKENNLGMPFPKGKIRMNKSDGTSTEFIGEDMINHTPKDEEIILNIGKAFDVKLDATTIERKKINNKTEEVEIEFKLRNRKSSEDVEVVFNCPIGYSYYNNWKILKLDYNWTKKNANTITFSVPVKKDSEVTFTLKAQFTNK